MGVGLLLLVAAATACSSSGKRCMTDKDCEGKRQCYCEGGGLECVDKDDKPSGECVSRDELQKRAPGRCESAADHARKIMEPTLEVLPREQYIKAGEELVKGVLKECTEKTVDSTCILKASSAEDLMKCEK